MAGKITNDDIKTSAELAGLGASDAQLPNDDKVYITALGLNKTLKAAIIAGDIGGNPVALKETLTLSAGDISAGYKDLSAEALTDSLHLFAARTPMFEGVDYTLSVVSLVTRITFTGSFQSGGDNELVEGDILYAEYIQA